MSQDLILSNHLQNQTGRDLNSLGIHPQKATYRNLELSLSHSTKSVMQEVADASEELSFAVAERRSQKLSSRRFRGESSKVDSVIEQYMTYINDVEDVEHAKYQDAHDTLEDLAEFLERGDIASDDPTQKFMGLLGLLRKVRSRNQDNRDVHHQKLEQDITAELEQLDKKHGKEIRAGVNIAKTANLFANTQLTQKDLRALYKESVLDFETLSDAYKHIAEKFGAKNFRNGLQFVMKAVTADLNSMVSSNPKERLKRIIDDLFTLKILSSIHDRCADTMKRLGARLKKRRELEDEYDDDEDQGHGHGHDHGGDDEYGHCYDEEAEQDVDADREEA